jgi:FG-GAP-like repeat
MRRVAALSAVLTLGLAAPAAAAPPTFTAPVPFGAGSGPFTIVAADFDLDGRPDLVSANRNSSGSAGITALRNTTPDGAAAPAFAGAASFDTGSNPRVVAVIDFNADGLPDLVTANEGSSGVGSLTVLRNANVAGAGAITFSDPTGFDGGTGPTSVAAADFDADGKADIVDVSPIGAEPVHVLRNTTTAGAEDPTFAAAETFAGGPTSLSVAAVDVNRDRRPDIVTANVGSSGAEGVSVLLNTTPAGGAPRFDGPFQITTTPSPQFVTATDANGDGRPDLALAHSSGPPTLLLNATPAAASSPTFSGPIVLNPGQVPIAVTSGDVNGDSKADLVFAAANVDAAQVLVNTTEPGAELPSYSGPTAIAEGSAPASIVAADLNADGRPDLAAANSNVSGAGGNTVNLNTTPRALGVAPASLNFGVQPLATISAPKTITLANSTDATLPVRVSVSGDAEDYLISRNDCVDGIPAGGSCDVSIRFAPGVKGTRVATMNLDPAGPQIEHVALSGDGGDLPQGSPGATGPKGDKGATGATGAAGAKGATGAQGPPGRDAKVTCKVAKRKKGAKKIKVTCRVRLAKTASTARWRLTRHGRTRAKGIVRGRAATLRLGRLAPGRYTLRIGGRTAATIRVTRR